MKVGIFDSGIGGLCVLKEIIKKYPNNEYIYYGDTIHLPYGEKTKDELKEYSDKIIKFLKSKNANIIVIACGTISSNIYNEIKDKYNIRIYDIISSTIEYVNKSNLNNICVIGTPKTIKSKFFKNNINKNIISISCHNFVNIIENNLLEKDASKYVKLYLKEIKDKKVDALILGCTHYPLLEDYIKDYLKYKLEIINMGEKLTNNLTLTDNSSFKLELYFSKVTNELKINVDKILENKYKIIEKIL